MNKFNPLSEDEIKTLEPSLRESYQKNFKALVHFSNLLIILSDHKFNLEEASKALDTANFVKSMQDSVFTKVTSIINTLRGEPDAKEEKETHA